MKVKGSHVLHGTREEVWEALQDPAVLVRTIPGCQELAEMSDNAYTATVKAGIASIQGTYDGRVSLSNQDRPRSYTLRAEGSGGPGTIDATARVSLGDDDNGTLVSYDAEAIVGGAIGGVGQRVLAGVAKRNVASFFEAVDAYLTGGLEEASHDDGRTSGSADESTDATSAAGRTFTSPAPNGGGAGATGSITAGPMHLIAAAVVGATIALIGVLVGRRLRDH